MTERRKDKLKNELENVLWRDKQLETKHRNKYNFINNTYNKHEYEKFLDEDSENDI